MDHDLKLELKLTQKLYSANRELLIRFPIEKYISFLDNYPKLERYGYTSPEVQDYCDQILEFSDKETLGNYHKLLLIRLISISKDKILKDKYLTSYAKDQFCKNFSRIIKNIEGSKDLSQYLYSDDKFRKSMAICSRRLIPLGALKVNIDSFSRKFLFRNGIRKFIEGILLIGLEMKGVKPLYGMHLDADDPESLSKFNEAGNKEFYLRVAEQMRIDTSIKGVYGATWLFDPALGKISPRHSYLRKIPTENGGKLFYYEFSEQDIKKSTLKSKKRKKLYEEGKYLPKSYLIIWSRKKLYNWARKNAIDHNVA